MSDFGSRKKIFTEADISSDLLSEEIDIVNVSGFAFEFDWVTADVTGLFTLEVSISGDSWVALPDEELSGTPEIAGADGVGFFNVTANLHSFKIRLRFTNTAGTAGTLNVWFGSKKI